MLRPIHITTISAIVVAALSVPAVAMPAWQHGVRSPDARDAARQGASSTAPRDLRSADSPDGAQHVGLYEVEASSSGARGLRTPHARDAAGRVIYGPNGTPTLVIVPADASPGGFDWGDAGIGAAGMLGILALTTGTALLVTTYRKRGRVPTATS